MVVAGWECQDLSSAGSGKGLAGPLKSKSFFPLMEMIGGLQQLQPDKPPVYLIENVTMQDSMWGKPAKLTDFTHICGILGEPYAFDATQVGSYAHRRRNYWSNMAAPQDIQAALTSVQRDSRIVTAIL